MANAQLSLDDLWMKCKKCDGKGQLGPGEFFGGAHQTVGVECPECHGKAGKVTSTGQAILTFLRLAKSHTDWSL